MNNLKLELSKFWNWAGITAEENSKGATPDHVIQAEWEDDYPGWKQLDSEIDKAIEDLSENWDTELAQLVVLTIALDNENGLIMDKCLDKLPQSDALIEMCCESEQPFARLEIAERIKELTVPERLKSKLMNDTDEHIRKIVSLSLPDDQSQADSEINT